MTVSSPQFTSQILSPKNDVLIASRNNHHDDSSGTPNLLENSLIGLCLLACSLMTLQRLFSDALKRSRKRTVRMSIRWLTGKKSQNIS